LHGFFFAEELAVDPQRNGKVRTDKPAFKTGAGKDIIRVVPGPAQLYLVVSSTLVSCTTHWLEGRSVFCPGLLDNCCHCKEGKKQRWEGWLAVCKRNQARILYLAVTPGAVECCPRLQDRSKTLVGLDLVVGRKGNTPNSEMTCAIQPSIPCSVIVPKCPDVCAWVERLWGLDRGCLERHPTPDDEVDLGAVSASSSYTANNVLVRKMIGSLKGQVPQ
jgi:hypothetical protein